MRRLGLVIALLACAAPSAAAAPGAPGTFDRSFGRGGVATLADPFLSYEADQLAAHGSGVLVGARTFVPGNLDEGRGYVIARFGPSGRLDRAFGDDGIVETGLARASVATLPGGRVVAVGLLVDAPSPVLVLHGYRRDGTSDSGFGTSGRAAFPIPLRTSSDSVPTAVQRDGRLLVALGSSIYRFTAAGALDSTFSSPPLPDSTVQSIAVQPDGRIVVAGERHTPGTSEWDIFVARLLADGSLDPSFAGGGAFVDAQAWSVASVALAPDGGIVASGRVCLVTGECDFALWRFTSGGSSRLSLPGRRARLGGDRLVVDRAGGIVVVGRWVYRLDRRGRVDRGFGRSGPFRWRRELQPSGSPVLTTRGRIVVMLREELGEFDPEREEPTDVTVARIVRLWGGYDRRPPEIRVRRACVGGSVRAELRIVDRSRIARLDVSLAGRRIAVRPGRRATLRARRGGRLRVVAVDQAGNRAVRALALTSCSVSG